MISNRIVEDPYKDFKIIEIQNLRFHSNVKDVCGIQLIEHF